MNGDLKRAKDLGYLIVVGGPGGSGSSTIAKLLCQKFNLRYIYGGKIMRDIAKKEGYNNLEEFLKKIDDSNREDIDKKIDKRLMYYSYTKDILIESKIFAALAFKYRIPCTVKIWLDSNIDVRARRKYLNDKTKTVEQIKMDLQRRYEIDANRYKDLYGIDYKFPKKYNDIVLDTSNMNEYQTLNLIIKLIEDGGYTK